MSQLVKKNTFYVKANLEDNQMFLVELDKILLKLVNQSTRERIIKTLSNYTQPLFLFSPIYFGLALKFIQNDSPTISDAFMKKEVERFLPSPTGELAQAKNIRRKINLLRYIRLVENINASLAGELLQ
jgi:hypothetical protein